MAAVNIIKTPASAGKAIILVALWHKRARLSENMLIPHFCCWHGICKGCLTDCSCLNLAKDNVMIQRSYLLGQQVPSSDLEKRIGKMAEDEMNEADLSGRLATVLEEIRDVMEKRKQRIEELRQEITEIENDNDDLEKTISELLDSFG
jgi:hypothetical protein